MRTPLQASRPQPGRRYWWLWSLIVLLTAGGGFRESSANKPAKSRARVLAFPNPGGAGGVLAPEGAIDQTHSFFQSLGRNGRACGTCHVPEAGWSTTPAVAQTQFTNTDGLYELFRPHDGANGPGLDISTVGARRTAYSLLLERAVFRIQFPIPPGAEFAIEAVSDPHGAVPPGTIAVFRRPLPATNLRFQTTLMWDGRESPEGRSLSDDLKSQAQGAVTGHAQGPTLADAALQELADFELAFHSAQLVGSAAGSVTQKGGKGGPRALARQAFYPGINDPFGPDARGKPFQPPFQLFGKWKKSTAARRAVARGEVLFNTRPINIRGVPGLNDVRGQAVIVGTCATCHNTPGVGSSSLGQLMDLNLEALLPRHPDEPEFTLRNPSTDAVVVVRDPGRALITGKWDDLRKFKTPSLRALAARPPYFHNGAAATLGEVMDFYDRRFGMGLTPAERDDLLAFLACL